MDSKFTIERTHYYAPANYVVMAVTITGDPEDIALRAAIDKAVNKHGILKTKVYLDEKGESFYSPIPKANYHIETCKLPDDDAWKQIIHEQERIPFDKENGEMIRFFLLQKEGEIQLVIVAHHLIGDGLSLIYLIRDIMEALENPGIEYEEMPVRLFQEKDYPLEVRLNPLVRFLMKQVNKKWLVSKKVFQKDEFLSMFRFYWQNRENEVVNAIITGSELQNLINQCKENSVSVNSAIVTAFLLAVQTEKEIGLAVSIRPENYEGMSNLASGFSIHYSPVSKTYWDNAKRVHKLIYKKLDSNNKKYFMLKFLGGLEPTLIDAAYFSAFAGYGDKTAARVRDMFGYCNNPKGISITNLTKPGIPNIYGRYAIERIEFVPPLVPNAKRIIGIVTIGDKLSISMQFIRDAEADEKREEFERTVMILRSGI